MQKEKIDKFGILLPRGSYTYLKGHMEYNPNIYVSYGKYWAKE